MSEHHWQPVCKVTDIAADSGVCALVNGEQVAIFKLKKTDKLFAISNYDPIGNANVLSRGIIGSIGEQPVVASPLYKQHFNLLTGECLENSEMRIKTYAIRIKDGEVEIGH